ncbi:tyrosine-type recombinase/integrase [Halobacteriaceae archaeon SHR40]|uniref:tyrosine-type recombinase/integrase n=1 Tax=Halovenus amylolytica TaxID=2500550 RepID=UPI000FE3B572
MSSSEGDGSVISEDQLADLNDRQREMYSEKLARFADYLTTEGKEPIRDIGYAEDSVNERVFRFHRMMKWIWNNEEPTIEFTSEQGDTVNNALETDSFRKIDGERFAEGSKRKFNDVLRNWFKFQSIDWEPEYIFSDGEPQNQPDPFHKKELRQIWEASLEYKTIPSYNNLTPRKRDEKKADIAQKLGKPKDEVRPADWDRINKCWKIPSLIRSTRGQGWRPDIIGRMEEGWYEPETQTIHIPNGEAPKNDASWNPTLSDEAAFALEKWLDQRELRSKYDGRDEIWLNREGNPYNSGSLNDLLDNLLEEAEISSRGRNLVWYSFRHSVGTYVYEEYKDLEIVAEQLRQKSKTSASKYVHPLPELKKEAAEIM